MIPADNQDVTILANELICQAGITCPQLSVASIHHGGNNQIFLIDCKEKNIFLKNILSTQMIYLTDLAMNLLF